MDTGEKIHQIYLNRVWSKGHLCALNLASFNYARASTIKAHIKCKTSQLFEAAAGGRNLLPVPAFRPPGVLQRKYAVSQSLCKHTQIVDVAKRQRESYDVWCLHNSLEIVIGALFCFCGARAQHNLHLVAVATIGSCFICVALCPPPSLNHFSAASVLWHERKFKTAIPFACGFRAAINRSKARTRRTLWPDENIRRQNLATTAVPHYTAITLHIIVVVVVTAHRGWQRRANSCGIAKGHPVHGAETEVTEIETCMPLGLCVCVSGADTVARRRLRRQIFDGCYTNQKMAPHAFQTFTTPSIRLMLEKMTAASPI